MSSNSSHLIESFKSARSARALALLFSAVAVAALLTGCATGARSPDARPVLYPNAALTKIGDAAAKAEVDACVGKAQAAGLKSNDDNNAVGQGAARGAAMAGVAGVVGSLVTGRGIEGALKQGAATAAVGGAVGATGGAFQNQPNQTYRHFVQRCVSEKGLEVIGWN
jgi:outer membrane lipoprotein SlyB